MSHTPTPWVADLPTDKRAPARITTAAPLFDGAVNPVEIAKLSNLGMTTRANAEFIVRACNTHDALVALLESAAKEAHTLQWQRKRREILANVAAGASMNAPLIADKLIAQSAAFVQASRERDLPRFSNPCPVYDCRKSGLCYALEIWHPEMCKLGNTEDKP